jgi:hypothetical protein
MLLFERDSAALPSWDHRAIYVATLAVRDPEVARPVSDLSHMQIR